MNEKILLGEIVGPIGIKGEVKVYSFGDKPSDLSKYDSVIIGTYSEKSQKEKTDELNKESIDLSSEKPSNALNKARSYTVEKARIKGNVAVVKLMGVDDRNAAEELRGAAVYVTGEDLEELPEGTYYVKDLEGLKVIDDDTDEEVGILTEVIQNGAQDIYRIIENNSPKEILVPAVREFIRSVDIEAGVVRIRFIQGMK